MEHMQLLHAHKLPGPREIAIALGIGSIGSIVYPSLFLQILPAEAKEDRECWGLSRTVSKESVGLNLPAPAKLAALPSLYFLTIKAINAHGGEA